MDGTIHERNSDDAENRGMNKEAKPFIRLLGIRFSEHLEGLSSKRKKGHSW